MSKNNQLKTEINELRKDRKNSFDIYKGLQDRVSGLKANIEDRKKQIEEKQQSYKQSSRTVLVNTLKVQYKNIEAFLVC